MCLWRTVGSQTAGALTDQICIRITERVHIYIHVQNCLHTVKPDETPLTDRKLGAPVANSSHYTNSCLPPTQGCPAKVSTL